MTSLARELHGLQFAKPFSKGGFGKVLLAAEMRGMVRDPATGNVTSAATMAVKAIDLAKLRGRREKMLKRCKEVR